VFSRSDTKHACDGQTDGIAVARKTRAVLSPGHRAKPRKFRYIWRTPPHQRTPTNICIRQIARHYRRYIFAADSIRISVYFKTTGLKTGASLLNDSTWKTVFNAKWLFKVIQGHSIKVICFDVNEKPLGDYICLLRHNNFGLIYKVRKDIWPQEATRKLCYRKDDRAMRPTYGCLTMPYIPRQYSQHFHGLLFRSTRWMFLQNSKSVALPVPEIIGGTQKFWAVPG